MKVIGLDGRSYNWSLVGREMDPKRKCSSYHLAARAMLQKLYSCDRILEEVALPGSSLTADFYLPSRRLIVEAQGEQHYRFNTLFHRDYWDFIRGKKRDADKRQWCEINHLGYAELPYDKESEWEERILKAVVER